MLPNKNDLCHHVFFHIFENIFIYMNNLLSNKDFNIPYKHLLKPADQQLLEEQSHMIDFSSKSIIFRQQTRFSDVMFIHKGLVKLYKQEREDKEHIIKLAKEGEYIGLSTIFGSELFEYSASSVKESKICFIEFDAFMTVFRNNNTYAEMIVSEISKEVLFLLDKLLNQVYKQLPGRIASVLLYFAESIYNSNSFEFPLTRKELAELTGTTKESFIRTLTEFKNDKIISLNGSNVKINSMEIVKTLDRLG